jgi:hypothetical protein
MLGVLEMVRLWRRKMFKVGDRVMWNGETTRYFEYDRLDKNGIYVIALIEKGEGKGTTRNEEWAVKVQGKTYWHDMSSFTLAEDFMENKNYEAACKEVDLMDGVCSGVKVQIKKVLAKALGVEVKEERIPQKGDVYEERTYGKFMLCPVQDGYALVALDGQTHWGRIRGRKEDFIQEVNGKDFTYVGKIRDLLK